MLTTRLAQCGPGVKALLFSPGSFHAQLGLTPTDEEGDAVSAARVTTLPPHYLWQSETAQPVVPPPGLPAGRPEGRALGTTSGVTVVGYSSTACSGSGSAESFAFDGCDVSSIAGGKPVHGGRKGRGGAFEGGRGE